MATAVAAGFVDFEITWRADVFAAAPQAGSAAKFGTLGITFRARKPAYSAASATSGSTRLARRAGT